jgi:hypothetical protein
MQKNKNFDSIFPQSLLKEKKTCEKSGELYQACNEVTYPIQYAHSHELRAKAHSTFMHCKML